MGDAADVWRERGLRDAAAAGDPDAWRSLYDPAYPKVAAYVRWRAGGRPDLADDVLQETWLVAARRLPAFDPAACRFAAWVCGIAANVVRGQVRSRLRYRRRVGELPADADPPARADGGPDGERVAAALADLPERYERVLRAKYLDGRTVDEIAAADGQSAKAVESLLTRARQAFREAYTRGD
jgi:RNA polymerase sigma-70 factor (ECF subfamily)